MLRRYKNHSEPTDKAVYFAGYEIEDTPAINAPTLFVVGPRPSAEIIEFVGKASRALEEDVTHIYASANQSLRLWRRDKLPIIQELLGAGYKVTLDGQYSDLLPVLSNMDPHPNLILMVSLELPFVDEFRKFNSCIKFDDTEFGKNNKGVWVHKLKTLTSQLGYTDLTWYGEDILLAKVEDLPKWT